ncbi:MAG TPA: DUF2905 domain-containing protein [Thermodesulfovibrionia bacterium]|nr:DUF2905 domain-containing protein [Thermodesulfovibrionia bacterium]
MTFEHLGKLLIGLGLLIMIVGVILIMTPKIPYLGRLPGDIFIRRKNFTFYFPLATSLVISILLSLLLWFISKK